MKYKLFITDYDGTMGKYSEVDSETVSLIKEYMKNGGHFAVCTGRMFFSIRQILLSYDIKCPVISYQGAMIDDLESGKRLYTGGINYELAAKVVSEIKKDGVDVAVDIGETRLYERESDFVVLYEKVTGTYGKFVENLEDEILKAKEPIPKITILTSPENVKPLREKYHRLFGDKLIVNSGSDRLVEIVDPKCDKGSAVERMAKMLNIPYNEVITVGDSTNDIELVRGKWHGVAVGDAKEELKKVAKEITVPFENHPIAYLLKKYCID